MNKLLSLISVDFKATFDIAKNKKGKSKNTSFKVFLGLIIGFGLLFSTLYNFIFIALFAESKETLIYPHMLFLGIAAILTLATSVTKVKTLFMGKDYEMLSSMPITKREIIISKLVSLFFVELLYSSIILLPNIVILTIFSSNFMYVLSGLLELVFVSGIPLLFACFIAMFIAMIADRYKFGNIISVVFYMIFFTAIFYFSFSMQTGNNMNGDHIDLTGYINMAKGLAWVNPTNYIIYLGFTVSYWFLLLYIPLNLVVIALAIILIAYFFDTVYRIVNSNQRKEVYVKKELQSISQNKAIFMHELKRFLGTKFYFINSVSAEICAIVLCAILGYNLGIGNTWNIPTEYMDIVRRYAFVGSIVTLFSIGITTPSTVSISIEGKNAWMLKAYPFDKKALLRAKFILSFITVSIGSILASVIMCALVQVYWYGYVANILISVAMSGLYSIIGLRINLKKYRFDWKNEQECCKNSSAVVITMFVDWAIMLLIGGLSIGIVILSFILPNVVIYGPIVLSAIAFGITWLIYHRTMVNADKLINRLNV